MNSKIEINKLAKVRLPVQKALLLQKTDKIIELLLNMPEITKNSPVFEHSFNTLSFELSFCDDNTIREINRTYRDKDKATDVITFALFADDENAMIINNTAALGEIIISTQTLVYQAAQNNNTVEDELYTLITHGVLHLFGFDHLNQKDYDFVVGIQEAVIKNL